MVVHWIMERVEENDELASRFEVVGLELWQQIDRAENGKTFSDPETPQAAQACTRQAGRRDQTTLIPCPREQIESFRCDAG